MKKSLLVFLFVCVLCVAITGLSANALSEPDEVTIYIDGELFEPETPAGIFDSVTYVPIRAFCEELAEVSVSWDADTETAYIDCAEVSLSASIGGHYIEANGRYFYIKDGCLKYEHCTMVPIRVLARIFGATVSWDAATESVHVSTGGGPIESGGSFYNADDVYWLSRIIFAESGGEPLEGQMAVGNVVLNRVADKAFPNTIYDVIFDHRFGTWQFTPAGNGAVYNEPSAESVIAAKLCLEGFSTAGGSLYFLNPRIASSRWFDANLTLTKVIGNHTFYA